jgi:hypothetical protein
MDNHKAPQPNASSYLEQIDALQKEIDRHENDLNQKKAMHSGIVAKVKLRDYALKEPKVNFLVRVFRRTSSNQILDTATWRRVRRMKKREFNLENYIRYFVRYRLNRVYGTPLRLLESLKKKLGGR